MKCSSGDVGRQDTVGRAVTVIHHRYNPGCRHREESAVRDRHAKAGRAMRTIWLGFGLYRAVRVASKGDLKQHTLEGMAACR